MRLLKIRSTSAFTLLELLLAVALIAVLASLLLPAYHHAAAKGRSAACQSFLRQLAMSMLMYSNDWRGRLPPYISAAAASKHPGTNWANWTRDYYGSVEVLLCPSGSGKVPEDTDAGRHLYDGSYAWNYEGTQGNRGPLTSCIKSPTRNYLLMDSGDQCIIYGANSWSNLMEELDLDWDSGPEGCNRHQDKVNCAFVDGHCESRSLMKFLATPCRNKEPPWHIEWQDGSLETGVIPFPIR